MVGACAREHLVDRHVGIDPWGDLAEDLHQRVLAEGDRGVRLLSGEQRGVCIGVELVARHPVEGQVVSGHLAVGGGGKGLEPQRHRVPVVERVVGVARAAVAVDDLDQGMGEPVLWSGVDGERDLVELGLAGGIRDLGQVDHDRELGRRSRHGADAAQRAELPLAALAAEPAGAVDVVLQPVAHSCPSSPGLPSIRRIQ